MCLGGDGVLLHASSLFKRAIPPVISFNLGSLGFLTNHTFDDYQRDLRDVITGGEDLVECSLPGEMMRVSGHARGTCYVWSFDCKVAHTCLVCMLRLAARRGPCLPALPCSSVGPVVVLTHGSCGSFERH